MSKKRKKVADQLWEAYRVVRDDETYGYGTEEQRLEHRGILMDRVAETLNYLDTKKK